jgi:hypothetical protein
VTELKNPFPCFDGCEFHRKEYNQEQMLTNLDTINYRFSKEEQHSWMEVKRLARLGAAVEAMPKGTSIKHCQIIGLEPPEYEWIVSVYQGPGRTYIYHNGLTPMSALCQIENT